MTDPIEPRRRWNPSPRTKIVLTYVLASVVGVAVLSVFVFSFVTGGEKPDDSAQGSGGAPAIAASPSPPSERDVVDGLGGDAHAGDDDGGLIDVAAEQAFAIAAVKAYAQWDSNETSAARKQRLEPYFAADSPVITAKPDTANEDALSHKGARTVTSPVGDGYASPTSATDTEVDLEVTLRYDSAATYDGYSFHYSESAVWKVTVQRGAPSGTKVISFEEPALEF